MHVNITAARLRLQVGLGLMAVPLLPGAAIRPLSGEWQVRPAHVMRGEVDRTRPPGERIRVASYNIQNFTDGIEDDPARTPEHAAIHARAAAALLAEIDADLVVLQEIENMDALQLLNRQFSAPYPVAALTALGSRWGNNPEKLNLAVLSRLPIRDLRVLDFVGLKGTGQPPRGALSFILELEGPRRLLVYNVHLKSNFGRRAVNRAKRRNALRIVREDAERLLAAHPDESWEILVLGDLNTDPDVAEFAGDRTLDPLADWVDLWRGRPLEERVTVPTRYGDPALEFRPATFDRFIVSPELIRPPWTTDAPRVLQQGVNTTNVFALPGVDPGHVSDHYPVYVDLYR